jgi:hypothetical protein
MPQGIIGPQGVTVISPPAREKLSKVAQLTAADGSTGFAAFGLPKDAFIAGVYFISAGANTTQTVNVGFTNGGVELASAYAPNSTGFATSGTATGASVGTELTADKTVYVEASATLTNTVTVIVDYWVVPVGQPY